MNFFYVCGVLLFRLKENYSSNSLARSLIAQRPLINERKILDEAAKKEQDVSK